jgi:hypothetical protein
MSFLKIIGRQTTLVDKTLETDLTKLKKDFEKVKEEGSPKYLETLLSRWGV